MLLSTPSLFRIATTLAGTLVAVLFLATRSATVAGEERTVRYPDGSPKQVFSVDQDGRRHGAFTELFPDGETKVVANYQHGKLHGPAKRHYDGGRIRTRATYVEGKLNGAFVEHAENGQITKQLTFRNGKLHGSCRRFEDGQLVRDEFWIDDRLLIPRMPEITKQTVQAIRSMPVETVGELPPLPPALAKAVQSPPAQQNRQDAVRVLMGYRFLCGVPYEDLKLDRTYIAYNVVACELLNTIGKMTHEPSNPGWPQPQYELGLKATNSSNLYTWSRPGSSAPPSMTAGVASWMDDSDEGNIQRLGHRRWCLNPKMQKVGIASSGKFCTMWVFDQSRPDVPDFDFVAFPSAGLTPTNVLEKHLAWHVSVNPKKYKPPQKDKIKVRVRPAQIDVARGELTRSERPLAIDYFNVDVAGFGIPNAIIFRPDSFRVTAGSAYWVEITGLVDSKDKPTSIEYLAAFFAL